MLVAEQAGPDAVSSVKRYVPIKGLLIEYYGIAVDCEEPASFAASFGAVRQAALQVLYDLVALVDGPGRMPLTATQYHPALQCQFCDAGFLTDCDSVAGHAALGFQRMWQTPQPRRDVPILFFGSEQMKIALARHAGVLYRHHLAHLNAGCKVRTSVAIPGNNPYPMGNPTPVWKNASTT